MPLSVTLAELRTEAYRLADQENATTRFPTAEVNGYINYGIRALWDILISSRGWPWIGKKWKTLGTVTKSVLADPTITFSGDPVTNYNVRVQITLGGIVGTARFQWSINGGSTWEATNVLTAATVLLGSTGLTVAFPAGTYTLNNLYSLPISEAITTVSDKQWYELPADFYKLYVVSCEGTSSSRSYLLEEMPTKQEPALVDLSIYPSGSPLYFQLQGARTGRAQIGFFPFPSSGNTIVVSYFPTAPVLVADADTFDGVNGWDEYIQYYAAISMALKDEEYEKYNALKKDMKEIEARIQGLMSSRSTTEPPRIQSTRAARRNRQFRWWMP